MLNIHQLEDLANDLEALSRLMLTCTEAVTPDEIGPYLPAINTGLYLQLEKLAALHTAISAAYKMEFRHG